MNFTQNEKLKQLSERSIVIGVDIASELHYARAFDWRGVELGKVFKFENNAEGFKDFHAWIERLKRQAQKECIVVGAEPTGHYWFSLASYLKEQSIKLVLVNPFHVKRSKELDDNHPSKTDAKDPKTIAKLVIEGRYNEPYIPEGIYAELRIAMACRMRIQKELNSIKNRIQRWLKIYFPEHETVFGKFDATSSMLVLQVAPLPKDIERLGVEGINRIWRDNKLRAVGMKRAKSLYEAAQKSIGCTEGESCSRMEIQLLLQDYHTKTAQYQAVTETIDGLCCQIPEVAKLLEIKGVGLVTVAGFLSEVGDIKRFNSPKQIQKLAGLALRESSSGKHKGQTTISKRGRARLRAILFQAVMPLVAKNAEFAEIHNYYTTRSKNPLKKKQSLIALSCKLIRVFYAILTKGTDYDPKKLITDIHRPAEYLAA
ncbi:transposase [Desulfitobacterium dehalogenans ATCC 51507]|uniref:Transposase n=1 Tax=Desulfitobacterium dehalogenans (strain ATCC 51507 / DSM 9161 / JW/IU-DC1) TaxID=756499 RepID=I4A7Y7_DESDJ|nr:IS110 family transposase [Desulfitobacterium dehalogenans]AFL99980.1 transposase [Desulfitobacterium dehalogenans ATCC 51507]AFM00072.1 transposase [Desulfitobacterium dehalogenans ATCC 51507]